MYQGIDIEDGHWVSLIWSSRVPAPSSQTFLDSAPFPRLGQGVQTSQRKVWLPSTVSTRLQSLCRVLPTRYTSCCLRERDSAGERGREFFCCSHLIRLAKQKKKKRKKTKRRRRRRERERERGACTGSQLPDLPSAGKQLRRMPVSRERCERHCDHMPETQKELWAPFSPNPRR